MMNPSSGLVSHAALWRTSAFLQGSEWTVGNATKRTRQRNLGLLVCAWMSTRDAILTRLRVVMYLPFAATAFVKQYAGMPIDVDNTALTKTLVERIAQSSLHCLATLAYD